MTSNLKRTLGGMLTLAVVFSAAEARAQKLEKPGAPSPEAATPAPSSGPATFGDSGIFALSAERLFGFTYTHQSSGNSAAKTSSTFTLLSAPFGDAASAYGWPRVGFDYFLAKSFSAGGSVSFFRTSGGGSSQTGFEVAPRIGYAAMVGPWLGIWPRAGVTFVRASGGITLQYLSLTLEPSLAFLVAPHFVITFGPTVDLGLTGSAKSGANSQSAKLTDVGAYFGFVVLL